MRPAGETAIGVDVGGTSIRVARIDRAGSTGGRIAEPVRSDRAGFAAQLARLVGELAGPEVAGVGIGIPGRVIAATGEIRSAGYLDIAGLDLGALLADHLGLAARVENDATMALLAEAAVRRDCPHGPVLMLTVGTGIGGAVLIDGAPFYGGGVAGQFGHIVVAAEGPACRCGRRGCVESLSSGTALGLLVAEAGVPEGTRAAALLDSAAHGNGTAAAILHAWAMPFRRALETLVAALDPELVVIGGGLGAEMVAALGRLAPPEGWFGLPVEAARLGDEAGVIGAGLRALDRQGARP